MTPVDGGVPWDRRLLASVDPRSGEDARSPALTPRCRRAAATALTPFMKLRPGRGRALEAEVDGAGFGLRMPGDVADPVSAAPGVRVVHGPFLPLMSAKGHCWEGADVREPDPA